MELEHVKFTRIDESTPEDLIVAKRHHEVTKSQVADVVLEQLRDLQNLTNGFRVTVYEHSLQTATRAYRDGADEDMVVVALLHDIGERVAPTNHAAYAAAVVGPYVSEGLEWLLKHHGVFQGYYYWHHLGKDRNARDRFIDHPMYDQTVEFCEQWDQTAFDPSYESLPLEFFEPMVRKVFARESRGFI